MKKNITKKNSDFLINELNIDKFIVGSGLVLNKIINKSNLFQDQKIKIENVKFDKNLSLILNDFNFPRLHLEIRDCEILNVICNATLHSIWISNSKIGESTANFIIFNQSNVGDFNIINTAIKCDISIKENSIFDRFQISSNLTKNIDSIFDFGVSISKSLVSEF